MTSRRYCQTNSAQALEETNVVRDMDRGSIPNAWMALDGTLRSSGQDYHGTLRSTGQDCHGTLHTECMALDGTHPFVAQVYAHGRSTRVSDVRRRDTGQDCGEGFYED